MTIMNEVPVLLIGYNRPDKFTSLINSLRISAPKTVLIAIDGPKQNSQDDAFMVNATIETIESIDWTKNIVSRISKQNLGLKQSISSAVSWALSEYGECIVLEDDVVIGKEFIDYAKYSLDKYREARKIFQINGYSQVPLNDLSNLSSNSRISRYPSSCAWATWNDRWNFYDDQLEWAKSVTLSDLKAIVGTNTGAVKWKLNFADALNHRIDSWATRWLASIWSNDGYVISPNRSLVEYRGRNSGTHTRTIPKWNEPSILDLPQAMPDVDNTYPVLDIKAEIWLKDNVYRESVSGVVRGSVASLLLEVIKLRNSIK